MDICTNTAVVYLMAYLAPAGFIATLWTLYWSLMRLVAWLRAPRFEQFPPYHQWELEQDD